MNSRSASARASLLTRWRKLSGREQWLTLAAAALVPVVHVMLRVAGSQRMLRWLAGTRKGRQPDSSAAEFAREAARAVERASRLGFYAGNCLSQSIALSWLLRRHGVEAQLRLGTRTREGGFEAHAWVTHAGSVLNDSSDVETRYAPLQNAPDAQPPA